MKRHMRFVVGLMLAAGVGGCAGNEGGLWPYRGTTKQQQQRAQRFDPYPSADVDRQQMLGARPREYDRPPSEPMRAQWEQWNPPAASQGR